MSGRHHGHHDRRRDDHRHHPYSRPPHHHHHARSVKRFESRRVASVEEALQSDSLLTKDDFLRVAKPTDSDLDAAYEDYVKQHQRHFLVRFYGVHGKDPWLMALYPALNKANQTAVAVDGKIQERVDWFIANCLKKASQIFLDTAHHADLIADSRVSSGNQGDGVRILQTTRSMPSALAIPNSSGDLKQLYINNIPPNASPQDLLAVIKETVPAAEQLVLSNPVPSKGFCRSGWLAISKSADDDTDSHQSFPEVRILDGLSFSASTLSFYPKDPHRRIKLVSGKFGDAERIRRDLHISQELITSMNVSRGIAFDMSEFTSVSDERLRLDLQIMFLRAVHWVCYYSAYEAACPEELARHCGDIVLRDDQIDADDLTVFDKKIQLLIDRGYRSLGLSAVSVNERLLDKYCQQLEAERWKCAICAKLFKGADFLLKHLNTKHEDVVAQETADVASLNAIIELPHFLLIPNSMIVRPAGPLRRYTRPPQGAPHPTRRHPHKPYQQHSTHNNHQHHHKQYVDLDAVRQSDSIDISYDL